MNTKMSKEELLSAINQQHGTLLELGLDGKEAVISLVKVAELTGRRHDDLLKRVRSMTDDQLGDARKNSGVDFLYEPITYSDAKGETRPTYNLNREAFYQFVLSMTGKKVAAIRDNYIIAFKAFEQLALHELHHEVAAVRLQLEHKQRSESIDELVKRLKPTAQLMVRHGSLPRTISRRETYRYFKRTLPDFQSKFPKEESFNKVLSKICWIHCEPGSIINGKAYPKAIGRGFVASYDFDRQGHQLEGAKVTALGLLYLQERMEQLYEQSII